MTQVLSRLCVDLHGHVPVEKLEVFTIRAPSADMTASLETTAQKDDSKSARGNGIAYPATTNFAFKDDHFVLIGVFLEIRKRLKGRYISGLFSIRNSNTRQCR